MFNIQRFASFENPAVSTLKVNVPVNAAGNIAQDGEEPVASKVISIKGFKIDGTAAEADSVFDEVLAKIAGTTYDTLTATQTIIKRMVDE